MATSAEADEFDDEMDDGRLVIADEERMDCTSSGDGNTKLTGKSSTEKLPMPDGQQSVDSSTALTSVVPDSTDNNSSSSAKMDCGVEDGEIVDDGNEEGNVEQSEFLRGENDENDRKDGKVVEQEHGVHNFLAGNDEQGGRKKKVMVDKSTSVFTRNSGVHGLDEHLLSMRPGSNLTIDITIVCKAGGNTLYISAKWKGREYHGVLTDGEPPHSHLWAQKSRSHHLDKRAAAASSSAESHHQDSGIGTTTNGQAAAHSERSSSSTAGAKIRGGKRGGAHHSAKNASYLAEKKSRMSESNSNGQFEHNANHSSKADTASATSSSKQAENSNLLHPNSAHSGHQAGPRRRRSSSSTSHPPQQLGLQEVNERTMPARCPHPQCGYRFEGIGEVNTHLLFGHSSGETKAKIFESSAAQTDRVQTVSVGCETTNNALVNEPMLCSKCKQHVEDEEKKPAIKDERPQALLDVIDRGNAKEGQKVDGLKGNNDISPGFSDISDDAAPTLEKEESFEKQGAAGSSESPRKKLTQTQQLGGEGKEKGDEVANATTHSTQGTSNLEKIEQLASTSSGSIQQHQEQLNPILPTSAFPFMAAPVQIGGGAPAAATSGSLPPTPAMFNPFMPFAPQFSQVLAAAVGAVASSTALPTMPSSSSSSAISNNPSAAVAKHLMSPPGLLSLGTPVVSQSAAVGSSSQQQSAANAGSSSGTPKAGSESQVHHKIYELQQPGSLTAATSSSASAVASSSSTAQSAARCSSTKPSGQIGHSVSPTPNMRPSSAIIGGAQQQKTTLLQHSLLSAQQQQQFHHQQQQQMLRPNAPSPLSNFGNLASTGFFPPLAGGLTMHGNPAAAAAAMLAAQQQQQQLAAAQQAAARRSVGPMGGQQQQPGGSQQQQSGIQAHQPQPGPAMMMSVGGLGTAQQQQQAQAQQQLQAMMMQSFGAGTLPLATAASMANFDLNTLQQYAALMASSSSSSAAGQSPQQQPQHRQTPK